MPKSKPPTAFGSGTEEPGSPIEAELRRIVELLRELVSNSLLTQREIANRCGWSDSRVSRMLKGHTGLRYYDLYTVLDAIHVPPGDFFHRLFP